ncbi:DNA phosphorothioation-dependent restriction protein DptF [Paenibacillus sp. LHD-117]|uniref:DNA phosphorothioation-dependent restriction protein DptF n=1 Tax=Paenibacillus sp. LHD-117 TaxID=3071412 RepID=UPI0027DF2FE2|nr:DNA phosphorothioation-dependent restriction protein DptF [Paenibacillus sp. LHD-117]MDQ6423054.1 DNA phosphorothioation-dependent restriction protein DptF [Paenibacillus sp. LHD-117]
MSERLVSSCLVSLLKKCKQSSKEAVDNLQSFDSFKSYMHIPRVVETELEEIIFRARHSEKSQLILVCGGVGDGKSHTLAYLKSKYPFLSTEFYIHNDATESFDPQKTSIQTLAECFQEFSDENLKSGLIKKSILAINLGALNNFIDSGYASDFKQLRNYVTEKEILEYSITSNDFDPSSHFQFVNFSDFHMFEITEAGTKSDYLSGLINKITAPLEENPFFKSYENNCMNNCQVAKQCPIKQNYELLAESKIQKKVIDLIINAVISEKLIVSSRAFLNFIYNIIVAPCYESLPDELIKEENADIKIREYVERLLPLLVFAQPDSSNITNALSNLSPTKLRNEQIDQVLINFRTVDDKSELFRKYLDINSLPYLLKQIEMIHKDEQVKAQLEPEIGRLFIHLSFFISNESWNIYYNPVFHKFVSYLYSANVGNMGQLANLYKNELREAIFSWNGNGFGDYISMSVGHPQSSYKTLQRLEIQPLINKEMVKRSEKELSRFLIKIPVAFKLKNTDGSVAVELDFSLYRLVTKIGEGYRPNKNDKLQFINFVDFINKLSELGNGHEEIIVEEVQTASKKKFSLSYDNTFENYKFMVV